MSIELVGTELSDASQIELNQLTYRGELLIDALYERMDYGINLEPHLFDESDNFSGQLVYVGYNKKTDTFIMVLEGHMANPDYDEDDEDSMEEEDVWVTTAAEIKLESGKEPVVTMKDSWTRLFYGQYSGALCIPMESCYKMLRRNNPDLIDITLD